MTVTTTPVLDDVYTKLGDFLGTIVPGGTAIVRGLANRVPSPPEPFVLMQAISQRRLETNAHAYAAPTDPIPAVGSQAVRLATELRIQIDFYGPDSGVWAAQASTLLRDSIGCDALAPAVQPLYADDPKMMPFITGEEQYLERWTLDAMFQWSPVTTVTQDFAVELNATLINVDEAYPP